MTQIIENTNTRPVLKDGKQVGTIETGRTESGALIHEGYRTQDGVFQTKPFAAGRDFDAVYAEILRNA